MEHRGVSGIRPRLLDERRDPRQRVDPPMDVVRVEDDQRFKAATNLATSSRAVCERHQDLVLLREAALGLLREGEVAVGDDVELALRALGDPGVDARWR